MPSEMRRLRDLAIALREIGRVECTLFIIDWLSASNGEAVVAIPDPSGGVGTVNHRIAVGIKSDFESGSKLIEAAWMLLKVADCVRSVCTVVVMIMPLLSMVLDEV